MQEIVVTLIPSKELTNMANRLLKKRNRTNRNLKLLAIAVTGYVAWAEMNRKKQNEKIEQLASQVEELGRGKEE